MTEKEFAEKIEELARLGDVEALTKFLAEHQQQREREWEKDDELAFRPPPRFGNVVKRWDLGFGMIYAVCPDQSVMVAFETECVNCGTDNLEYIGSIYELEVIRPRPVKVPPQKQLE